jgi:hypothetical protein
MMPMYDTVTEALDDLKNRGYENDFNLQDKEFYCPNVKRAYRVPQLQIKETYRFEGNTDPADEAVVYALQAGDGVKGTFINGYGTYADTESEAILQLLECR